MNQQDQESHVLTRWYPGLERSEIIDGVPVYRFGFSGPFKLDAISFAIHCILWILIKGKTFQVIHTHNMDTPLLVAAIVKILTRKKWVNTIHGEWHLPNRMKTRIGRMRVSFMLRLVDQYVSISEANNASMLEVGIDPARIASIPNSIDIDYMRPATNDERSDLRRKMNYREDEIIVLYLARLLYRKRPDLLINALARIDTKNIRCIIAGDGDQKFYLEELIATKNLNQKIEMVGSVNNVREYFWISDVYVLPSQYEGLPVALLESMACGKSILVSRCAGNLQAIVDGENGLGFEVDNEEHLASQLKRLIDDPNLRTNLGFNAYQTIREKYSMKSVSAQHTQLYYNVLNIKYPF